MSRIDLTAISDAKRAANQRNAQLSTGPRTPEGKQRSSQNALTHGLFADTHLVLPGESQAAHDTLQKQFEDSLQPSDAVEASIVERMIANRWKLCRLKDLESKIYEHGARAAIKYREDQYLHSLPYCEKRKDREAQEPLREQSRQRCETDWKTVAPGTLLLSDTRWEDLARHEKRLEDQFYKAQRELRLWRKEKRTTPPPACGFADEDPKTPQEQEQTPIPQNEPNEATTPAPTATYDPPPPDPIVDTPSKEEAKLPANPIHPIPLNVSPTG